MTASTYVVRERVVDFTASGPTAAARRRLWLALGWLAGWTAFVVAMAAVVSAQKAIPFRYTITSEAVNYYTLAALSLILWFASARMGDLG